ncbi:MAG: hypothetical protein IK140_10390 [Clostridia bacterium]|nr:hypothetical protein [Clostridia bacterium]
MDTKRAMLRFISLLLCLMLVLSGAGVRTLAEGTALPQAQETQDPADDGEDGTEGNVTDGEGADGDETDGEGTDGDGTDGEGADGEETVGDGTEGDGTDGDGADGEGTEGEGAEGEGADGDGTDGEGAEGGETDGEGTGAEGSEGAGTDGDGTDGNVTDGNGTDGEGIEGDGTDGDGIDGEGTDGGITDGEGTDGDGAEGNGTDGNGADGEGAEGDGTDGVGTDGEGAEGDGEGTEGDGTDDNGTDGDGTDGESAEGDGEGTEGEGIGEDGTDSEGTEGDGIEGEGTDGEGAEEEDGEEPEPEIVFATGPVSESLAPIGGADNDALFEQYIRRNLPGLGGGVKLRSASPSAVSQLNENTQKLCNALIPMLQAVAEGNRTSTEFTITAEQMDLVRKYKAVDLVEDTSTVYNPDTHHWSITSEALTNLLAQYGFQFDLVIRALLADCPYTLYWYDKTTSTYRGWDYDYEFINDELWLSLTEVSYQLPVSQDYRGKEGTYSVDSTYPTRVKNAKDNIETIIHTHASESDYAKLESYKTEICSLVEYNYYAADDNNNVAYGDPWQLVFVFDGDSTTNVVCEGYSKAFKYLCDRSTFTGGTRCITVSGNMQSGETNGGHMWNIVYMPDDRYYLVDVTNCDGNTVTDWLFLKGWIRHPSNTQYVFRYGSSDIYYTYDSYMSEIHGSAWLDISKHAYGTTYYSIDVSSCENGTVTADYREAAEEDIITLTVQAAEGFRFVDGSLKVTGPDGDITFTDNGDGTFTFTMPAGNVAVSAAFAAPAFANHSVVLKGLIGVDFYMDLPGGASAYPGSYMSFAGNNGKIDATANTPSSPDGDGQYKYTCYVSSIQMAEKITPTFHYTQGGQEFTIEGEAYSAEDYIKWAKDNLSDTNLTIVKALADYGYYAQQYLSVQNGWTIGTDYAAMTTHFTEPSGFNRETILAGAAESAFTATENSQTVAQSGYRLNLGSTISLDVRMLPAEGTEITSVTLDGAAAAVTVSGQYSVVTKSGIMASGLADEYIIVAGDCTIHVSAMSYVYEMLGRDNSSATFKNLLCALYEYAKACK